MAEKLYGRKMGKRFALTPALSPSDGERESGPLLRPSPLPVPAALTLDP